MSNIGHSKKADQIRVLNDNFRTAFIGGQVVMTVGVDALPHDVKACALGSSILQRFHEGQ